MWIRQLDERLQKEFKKYLNVRGVNEELSDYMLDILEVKERREYQRWLQSVEEVHKKVNYNHEEFLASQLLQRFTHDTSCKGALKMEGYITCSQTEDCHWPSTKFYGYLWMLLMVCTCILFPHNLSWGWHPKIHSIFVLRKHGKLQILPLFSILWRISFPTVWNTVEHFWLHKYTPAYYRFFFQLDRQSSWY